MNIPHVGLDLRQPSIVMDFDFPFFLTGVVAEPERNVHVFVGEFRAERFEFPVAKRLFVDLQRLMRTIKILNSRFDCARGGKSKTEKAN